jgi:hypothetical protein
MAWCSLPAARRVISAVSIVRPVDASFDLSTKIARFQGGTRVA